VTHASDRRRRAIAELIRSEPLGSQEEVTARLKTAGHAVTQATVSRDLEQLGAIKVKRDGVLRYTLPAQIGDSDWAVGRLAGILADWMLSVEVAGNLLVLRTPPASAHLVAAALDQARLGEIVGTISGDDTLFVAVKEGAHPHGLADRFREWTRSGSDRAS
jgi:transcriptional regulator of arginine metabolism